ncbi:PulJ/GspJ family protein [Deinococcus pimensis]|nr:prepilin-type N-terminal cleavage/methylation domain-containing protein [Deinococcus pimensis]
MRHVTSGLTLIEILVAIALTSVVALMSYYLLPAVSINTKAKSRFEAS